MSLSLTWNTEADRLSRRLLKINVSPEDVEDLRLH